MVENANPILGLAGSLATTYMNNRMAQENASISYNRQKELMDIQNKMNMNNAMNMPGVQAFGLKQAGFNPAMVQGAGTQAAPTVSQGNADMPQTIPFNAQDALLFAQMENIKANTNKVEEEAEGVKKQNDITDAANDAAVRGYLADWNREQEDLEKALKGMKEGSEEWNKTKGRIQELEKMKTQIVDPNYRGALGIAKGTEAARNETRDRMAILHEYLTGALDNSVAQKKLGNGTIAALAGMPVAEKTKLDQDIEKVKQDIAESESREVLNDQTVKKLKADIEEIGDRMFRAQLNDRVYVRHQINYYKSMDPATVIDKDQNITAGQMLKVWEGNFDALNDEQWRSAFFEVGKSVITGAATGGAIGAANSMLNSVGKGKKGRDYGKELRDNRDEGTNIFNKSNNPLESWTDRGAYDENKGTQLFKF